LIERTGDVSDDAWRQFLAAGFDRTAALEIAMGVATYTLTTFANRLTQAPVD
jgi:alkylhydroperoxidase family enzyme